MRTVEEIKVDIERTATTSQKEHDMAWLEWFRVVALLIVPDRLIELCQAEREGRCVVMPCKVGDTAPYSSPEKPQSRQRRVIRMDRLTTDNPKTNMESAYNIFRIKNKETVCNLTEDNGEISLYDLMRQCAKTLNCRVSYEDTNDSIGEFLFDSLYDGCTTPEGILAHFYTTAWALSALRAHLAAYEDTGLMPAEISAMQAENATLKKALELACGEIARFKTGKVIDYYMQKARATE